MGIHFKGAMSLENQIVDLLHKSLTNSQISKQLKCDPGLVTKYRKKHQFPSGKKEIDWVKVQEYYDGGSTIRETALHFKINPNSIRKRATKGLFKTRNPSEAAKLQQKLNPRTHTQKTKDKLSKAMVKRRENGYNWSFAHSKNNGISYPEQFWMDVIQNEFEDKNYTFQFQMGRFAIDFAWPHKKIALEIDGDQHYTQPEQKIRDENKESLLRENGWTIIRIRWKVMFKDPKKFINEVKNRIDNG